MGHNQCVPNNPTRLQFAAIRMLLYRTFFHFFATLGRKQVRVLLDSFSQQRSHSMRRVRDAKRYKKKRSLKAARRAYLKGKNTMYTQSLGALPCHLPPPGICSIYLILYVFSARNIPPPTKACNMSYVWSAYACIISTSNLV